MIGNVIFYYINLLIFMINPIETQKETITWAVSYLLSIIFYMSFLFMVNRKIDLKDLWDVIAVILWVLF